MTVSAPSISTSKKARNFDPNSLTASRLVALYLGSFTVFLAIDFVWLSFASAAIYQPALGHLMAETANLGAAFLFYLMYVGGVLYLAVGPSRSLSEAAIRGGVLGLVAYGTYDMTSLAVFKDWPVYITVLDMVWGCFLTACVSVAGCLIRAKLAPAAES